MWTTGRMLPCPTTNSAPIVHAAHRPSKHAHVRSQPGVLRLRLSRVHRARQHDDRPCTEDLLDAHQQWMVNFSVSHSTWFVSGRSCVCWSKRTTGCHSHKRNCRRWSQAGKEQGGETLTEQMAYKGSVTDQAMICSCTAKYDCRKPTNTWMIHLEYSKAPLVCTKGLASKSGSQPAAICMEKANHGWICVYKLTRSASCTAATRHIIRMTFLTHHQPRSAALSRLNKINQWARIREMRKTCNKSLYLLPSQSLR